MEKTLLIILAVFILLLSSCSNPSVYYSVWKGNNTFDGGDYQTANTAYLKALEHDIYVDYISYNLANVYYALGEGEAASAEWKNATFTGNATLLFRTLYNRGVLEFESGSYQDAFSSFRKSLEINPESMAAKINLEYSLRRMNSGSNTAEGSAAGAEVTEEPETSDEIQRVLEFIKQKDAGLWAVNEEAPVATDERDW